MSQKKLTDAKQFWDRVQEADGEGLALTDDSLLAEFVSRVFDVEPTDIYDEYEADRDCKPPLT